MLTELCMETDKKARKLENGKEKHFYVTFSTPVQKSNSSLVQRDLLKIEE